MLSTTTEMTLTSVINGLRESEEKDNWVEQENALGFTHSHYLDQISDRGLYKTEPKSNANNVSVANKEIIRIRLNATISIMQLQNINCLNESFKVKSRLFLFWEVDLHSLGMEDVAQKALDGGHYYSMSRSEIELFESKYDIPAVTIFNSIEDEDVEPADIRVYGGAKGFTAVMWNRAYVCTCREHFELQDFPFDQQDLTLEIRLNSPKTWELFDLSVNAVQFHKNSLQLTEWMPHAPIVTRDNPKTKVSKINMKIVRFSGFYIQNVVLMMFANSLLGLISFAMDITDLGSRVSTLLTLLLTAVAFKFSLAGSLPKVPYNTLIDYFILSSMLSLGVMTGFTILPAISFDDTTSQTILNKTLGWVSFVMIVGTPSLWLVRAFYIKKTKLKTPEIVVVPQKNWYCFRYSNPSFLANVPNIDQINSNAQK